MRKLIIIIGLLAILIFGTGCNWKASSQVLSNAPTGEFLSQNTQTISDQTAKNLTEAKTKTIAWQDKAALVAYNLKIPADLKPESISETFVFGSTEEPDSWWTISFDKQGQFVRAIIPKEDYLGKNLLPIEEQYWQKNYLEAVQIAEDNGGLKFRSENPEAEINLILEKTPPKDWNWWVVEYRGATKSLKIRISALDGKIYDEQGNLL